MDNSKSVQLEETLGKPDIHKQWEQAFRTPANEQFYEMVFDMLVATMALPPGATCLDAGCGIGAHSMRLAKRGLQVTAVDFAESVLAGVRANVATQGLDERIHIQSENILALSFADKRFDCVLCWGVLMHISQVETAVAELARVVKPGGFLILAEDNMSSWQAWLRRGKAWVQKGRGQAEKTAAGLDYWTVTPAGKLLAREANIHWLTETLTGHGLTLHQRRAGQFTTLYTRAKLPAVARLIHSFNRFWFQNIKWPQPAFSNLIIMKKPHNHGQRVTS